MTALRPLFLLATTCAGILASGAANATAQIGGVISTSFAEAFGACNRSTQVPLTTLQDSFSLGLVAPCAAGSASGDLKAMTATGSAALKVSAAGTGVVSAEVSLIDRWLLTPPAGTVAGTYLIGVTLGLDGSVSPGSFARLGGNFLSYWVYEGDAFGGVAPGSSLALNGNVTSTGAFSQTVSGNVSFRYFGVGGPPTTADIIVQLFVPQLQFGTVDFYNTASISMALPAGWTAQTSSGLPVVSAVPEPAAVLLMLLGLGVLAQRRANVLSSRA